MFIMFVYISGKMRGRIRIKVGLIKSNIGIISIFEMMVVVII